MEYIWYLVDKSFHRFVMSLEKLLMINEYFIELLHFVLLMSNEILHGIADGQLLIDMRYSRLVNCSVTNILKDLLVNFFSWNIFSETDLRGMMLLGRHGKMLVQSDRHMKTHPGKTKELLVKWNQFINWLYIQMKLFKYGQLDSFMKRKLKLTKCTKLLQIVKLNNFNQVDWENENYYIVNSFCV